jgi:hypothetical protein
MGRPLSRAVPVRRPALGDGAAWPVARLVVTTDEAQRHAAGPAHWRRYLAAVPVWALEDELARRREAALGLDAIAVGDELLVDPIASLVRWRGVDYHLSGRLLDVCYALALGWLNGRPRLRSTSLAQMVWRGRAAPDAQRSLWQAVAALRRRVPGLIGGGYGPGIGYHFQLASDSPARRVASAVEPGGRSSAP